MNLSARFLFKIVTAKANESKKKKKKPVCRKVKVESREKSYRKNLSNILKVS